MKYHHLFCKACGNNFSVSDRFVTHSDNDWFYCSECGSGNVIYQQNCN